jgi:transcriptional regulator with XRE-family HTH domain
MKPKVQDVGEFIRTQRAGAQMSLRKLAKLAGVSNPYLSQVERGLRRPSAEILSAIAKGLRVSSQTLYVKAGILEEQPHPDVHTAIVADPILSEQQKQVLLQVYDSFRQETGRKRSDAKASPRRPASSAKTGKTNSVATARRTRGDAVRRSPKLGGGTEMQADPSPHPAPLRPSATHVPGSKNGSTSKARKEVHR